MLWIALLANVQAEDAWATRDVELQRWPETVIEAPPITAEAAAGDKLEIVLEDGDIVRVKKDGDFGWVPADALSKDAPEDEEATDAPAE